MLVSACNACFRFVPCGAVLLPRRVGICQQRNYVRRCAGGLGTICLAACGGASAPQEVNLDSVFFVFKLSLAFIMFTPMLFENKLVALAVAASLYLAGHFANAFVTPMYSVWLVSLLPEQVRGNTSE